MDHHFIKEDIQDKKKKKKIGFGHTGDRFKLLSPPKPGSQNRNSCLDAFAEGDDLGR